MPGTGQAALVYAVGDRDLFADVTPAIEAENDVELVGARESVGAAVRDLDDWDVDVVLFATCEESLPHDELAAIREHTSAPIVLLAPATAPDVLTQALAADIAEALLMPQPPEAVLFAVRKAAGRRASVTQVRASRVVTVFSPKGGTGKTVTATNLAATVATQGLRTLLVDFDLQFGDCATVLGLEPNATIHDLVAAPGQLDAEKLAGYTTPHSSGAELLAAPANPDEAELVAPGKLVQVLEVAREAYDAVVIDTPPALNGPTLTALDHSDDLLLVATLDLPTLKGVRQSLEMLELIEFPSERISLVLNRADAPVGITQRDVEAALDVRMRFALPEDRAVPLAVNRAVPVVIVDEKAAFSSAMRTIAETVLTAERTVRREPVRPGRT